MKLEMKTGFAVILLVLFIVCIFCVGWVGVADAVELPSTPTPAPTMKVCAPNPTPTPTPAGIPMPEPEFEIYLPIVVTDRQNFDLFECVKSGLCPLPTPAPTMNPFPCEGGN